MTFSPYDSLPSGNNDIPPETPQISPVEYTEVDLKQLDIAPAKVHIPSKPIKTKPLDISPQYVDSHLKNFAGCTEYILPFEESLLVPDTMADMREVLFAEGRADLSPIGKSTYDKNDFLSGSITIFTVYKPVSSSYSPAAGPAAFQDCPVDVVKSVVPFRTDKCWTGAGDDSFRVDVSIKSIAPEMINERKFIVKGELLIKLFVISDHKLMNFIDPAGGHIITCRKPVQVTVLDRELSDTTEISQDITLKEGLPLPVKILKTSIDIAETHKQITSGKLILNGCIHYQVLYTGKKDSGEFGLCCTSGKTDFSQFILINEDADVDLVKVIFRNDLDVTIEDVAFLLSGNVTTLVQSYDTKTVESVCDAYHKKEELLFDLQETTLDHVAGVVGGEISSREVVNISDDDKKPAVLLCGSCTIASLEGSFDHGRIVVNGTLRSEILALDDEDSPFIIEHTIPVKGSLEMAGNKLKDPSICIDAAIKDFWFGEINARQVELNSTLTITAWACTKEKFCTIDNLRFADMGEAPSKPSMAIYVTAPGESLWDVAKRYKCSISDLVDQNDLDPDADLIAGTKLFCQKYV